MNKKRTEYSESFKAEATSRIKDNNGNITQTAKKLGIPMNRLANWQRKANSRTLAGTDNYSPDLVALQEENKELKKQLKISQEEQEILNEEGKSEALLRPDARRRARLGVQRRTLQATASKVRFHAKT